MSDLTAAFLWWLVIQLFGFAAVPLAFRLLRWLPDRGYSLSKAMGLLLVSYLFWLLNSLGFLRNSAGSIVLAAGLVALFSIWVYRRQGPDQVSLWDWMRSNLRLVLTVELFFLAAFALWVLVRSYNPEITATEKPMDLAFINAVSRSDHFPPLDPWLSGFAISYYYFGYLMTASIAKVTALPGSVAFNLGLAWQFAGTLLGGFGLAYNLIAASQKERGGLVRPVGWGLLGSLLVGVMGNLEALLELLHINGILPASFWAWLDIKDINIPPPVTAVWPPRSTWWWWRASRVIHDRTLAGESMGLQPIDEFPFFSFLLGDLHPHVLALPFVFVALGLALNWWIRRWEPGTASDDSFWSWIKGLIRAADPVFLLVTAICLGALGFLNTWDFPFYLFVMVGAWTLAQLREGARIESGFVVESTLLGGATVISAMMLARRWLGGESAGQLFFLTLVLSFLAVLSARLARMRWERTGRWSLGLVGQVLSLGLGLLLAGLTAYLPFYLGFRSQAGGILPNVINPTRLAQFSVMFGPFLFILLFWMVKQAISSHFSAKLFVAVAGGLLAAMLIAAAVFAVVAILDPEAQAWVVQAAGELGSAGAALRKTAEIRLTGSWTALLLLAMIGAVFALWDSSLLAGRRSPIDGDGVWEKKDGWLGNGDLVAPFVLLLILTGALLTLAPEFVYLRDNFGARLNTVFKFYYQAWVMFAIASAYALFALVREKGWVRWVAGLGGAVLIASGLLYPVLSVPTKTDHFSGPPTLDGMAYMARSHPGDYAAIKWLQENVDGTPVILEAVGGQYSWGGRIAVHTGLPTVLGWAGHEDQWRGFGPEPRVREADIETLYTSRSTQVTQELLDKYQIEYVIVGSLELSTFGQVASVKFDRFLETVFETDGVKIYRWNSLTW